MIQIVCREKDWKVLNSYLLTRHDVESAAYGVFKSSNCCGKHKILLVKVFIPSDRDYLKRSNVCVAFRPDFTENVLRYCELTNGHLLDIHTHPWSKAVDFSSIDDREAKKAKIPYLEKYLPRTIIAFMVFGQNSGIIRARIWSKSKRQLLDVTRIIVI